ncbi:hypothetical protein GCM10027047_01230 [Rhodococcus aerolatus]
MTDAQWFLDRYDEAVAESGSDGTEPHKVRDQVAQRYCDDVETGRITPVQDDLVTQGRNLFDRVVKPERDRRRSSMRRTMGDLLDAINGETILGTADPKLDQAFALGDGRDKSLRHWTVDDWQAATTERYRNAAQATASASTFDEGAAQIVSAIRRSGVRTTGDLLGATA